uniref:Replication factor C subunit 1 n=1 Tax=Spongospora subterranea TaxID=70186 RepID=A0A0H5QX07_9EUKA|eukprot:CRZ06513.1 hypothetical protein [Spongospora subterranea]
MFRAVTTNVSSRTTHLIAGDEAGPKKVSMAKEKGIPIMNEDELFKLISSSSSITNSSAQSGNSKISKAKQLPVLQAAMSGPDTFLMWVDKYKPTTSSQLCANATLITKLSRFLKDWPNTDAGKHAVLLSGPPGIGKSSAAGICAKEAGYTVIEMNASTTRSKKSLLAHTKELLQSHNISRFFTSSSSVSAKGSMGKKTVLIMDEVDGMSNGDRGGMQELYLLIKTTKIPIICICNDRNSMKVKTLASYCIDLRFRRPMATQIAQRMQSIAKAEGLEIDQPALMKLAEITHGDIRQMLNTMQMWRAGSTSTSFEDIKRSPAKDFDSSAFDVAPQLFHTVSPLQSDWLSKRMEAYFVDPDLIPLMVQGNYLNCIPQLPIEESSQPERYRELFYLERYSKAASSISDGDIIGNQIRSMSSWSLMPVHGVLSSVVPAVHVAGRLQGMIDFPQWLGKNSIRRKNQRLLSEIHSCLVGHISGGTSLDIALDYLPVLRRRLTQPLSVHGQEGINEVIKMMNHYHLSRTDFDTLIELGNGLYEKISLDSKVKAKFTREFSRRSIAPSVSGKRARLPAIDREKFIGDDEGEHSSPDIDIDEGTDSENGNEFDIPAPSKKSAASKKPDVSKRKAPAKSTSLRKKVRA